MAHLGATTDFEIAEAELSDRVKDVLKHQNKESTQMLRSVILAIHPSEYSLGFKTVVSIATYNQSMH